MGAGDGAAKRRQAAPAGRRPAMQHRRPLRLRVAWGRNRGRKLRKEVNGVGDSRGKAAPLEEKWVRLERMINMNFNEAEVHPGVILQLSRTGPGKSEADDYRSFLSRMQCFDPGQKETPSLESP